MSDSVGDIVRTYDPEARFRALIGRSRLFVAAVAAALSLFQLYTAGTGPLEALKQRSLHLTLIMVLAFLLYPGRKKSDRQSPTWLDWVLAAAAVVCVGYLFYNYQELVRRNGVILSWELAIGAAGILLLLEAGRRVLGKELLILALLFLAYAYLGRYIPGPLGHRGYGPSRIIEHMWFGTEGVFGMALSVSATYMFLFVLFGAVLGTTGLSQLINDGAMALAGRRPGGPAKVAVLATGFMGTLTGSAVANAAATGSFTIPMMKRAGYRPEFAAGIEGAGGTGGAIMPPVMGAAAFLMAETLGIPYGQIIVAAAIPAFLYYLSLWVMVHFEARKLGLRGVTREELPDLRSVFRERGHLLVPVALMIYLLVANYTPLFAGYWAIIATFAIAWAREELESLFSRRGRARERLYTLIPAAVFLAALASPRFDASSAAFLALFAAFLLALFRSQRSATLRALRASLQEGARRAVGVALATAIVGFIVGTASLTSMGLNIGASIVELAGGNVLVALFLIMVTCIIVGTGIPTTPMYVMVSLIAAPVLTRMGIHPLAAHLFVFYYGALADVTPPTALSSYTAAGIAGADPQRTTWIAWKLALAGFIIPYYFTMDPVLLLNVVPVSGVKLAQAISTSVVGTIALAMALQGWALRRAGVLERAVLLAAALLLIAPGIRSDLVGLALLGAVLLRQRLTKPVDRPPGEAEGR